MVDYNLVNKIIYGNNNNNSFNKANLSHANSFKILIILEIIKLVMKTGINFLLLKKVIAIIF